MMMTSCVGLQQRMTVEESDLGLEGGQAVGWGGGLFPIGVSEA